MELHRCGEAALVLIPSVQGANRSLPSRHFLSWRAQSHHALNNKSFPIVRAEWAQLGMHFGSSAASSLHAARNSAPFPSFCELRLAWASSFTMTGLLCTLVAIQLEGRKSLRMDLIDTSSSSPIPFPFSIATFLERVSIRTLIPRCPLHRRLGNFQSVSKTDIDSIDEDLDKDIDMFATVGPMLGRSCARPPPFGVHVLLRVLRSALFANRRALPCFVSKKVQEDLSHPAAASRVRNERAGAWKRAFRGVLRRAVLWEVHRGSTCNLSCLVGSKRQSSEKQLVARAERLHARERTCEDAASSPWS